MRNFKKMLAAAAAFCVLFSCLQSICLAAPEPIVLCGAEDYVDKHSNSRVDGTTDIVNFLNGWSEYSVTVSQGGMYKITGDIALAANAVSSVCILTDGVISVVGTELAGTETAWGKQIGVTLAEGIPLAAGTHIVRFYTAAGNIMHYNFTFTYTDEMQTPSTAYLAPSSAMISPGSTITKPLEPNAERVQVWANQQYYYRVNLATGMYRIKLLTNVSKAYPAAATLTVDGAPAAENVNIEARYETDSPNSAFYEVTLSESFQIRNGQHIIALASTGSKFFYFRRLIIEKVGDVTDSNLSETLYQTAINFDYAAGEGVGFHDNNDVVDNENTQCACFIPVDVNTANTSVAMSKDEWLRYGVNAAKAGWYDVTVNYGITGANPAELAASTGGQTISAAGADTGGYNTFGKMALGTLYLNEGDNEIIIKNNGSSCHFMGFVLTKTDAVKLYLVTDEAETQIAAPEAGALRIKAGVSFETGGVLIGAAYKDKEMVSISDAIPFAAGVKTVSADLSNVPDGATIKVFLFESLESVKPLDCETVFPAK